MAQNHLSICYYLTARSVVTESPKTLLIDNQDNSYSPMNVDSGERGTTPPWIFVRGTDKVEGGLMVLFLALFFSVAPFPGNFSADALVLVPFEKYRSETIMFVGTSVSVINLFNVTVSFCFDH